MSVVDFVPMVFLGHEEKDNSLTHLYTEQGGDPHVQEYSIQHGVGNEAEDRAEEHGKH